VANPLVVGELARAEPGAVVVAPEWPVGPERLGPVALSRIEVYAPGARIVAITGTGEVEVVRSTRRYFLGESLDDPDARIMVWLDPETGDLGGVVITEEGEFELAEVAPGGMSPRYALLNIDDLSTAKAGGAAPWSCGLEEGPGSAISAPPFVGPPAGTKGMLSLHTAVIAVDTDNELMSLKFSNNTAAATAYLADIFARMNVIYERDLNVRLLQGHTILRVATDPYHQSSTGSADYAKLDEFRDYWVANYSWADRALAMMVSGKQGSSSSASGIAWLDALCSSSIGYSFNQVFKANYPQSDAGLIAHELGHNFGSHHTHCYSPPIDECYGSEAGCYSGPTSCPTGGGTLMSYCHSYFLPGCWKSQLFHPVAIAHLDGDTAWAAGVCLFEAAPEDTEPPEISDAVAAPRITTPGSEITISATIVDELSGVASAEATVRDGGGSVVTTLAMSNSSGDTWQAVFDSTGALLDTYTVDLWAEDGSDDAHATTSVAATSFELRSSFVCNLELSGFSVDHLVSWEVCGWIVCGPDFTLSFSGEARMTAGKRVAFRSGFVVHAGGVLTVAVDPTLEQD
jgi:hypothetical protein